MDILIMLKKKIIKDIYNIGNIVVFVNGEGVLYTLECINLFSAESIIDRLQEYLVA